ncbi:GGDEF domain-containing protein [Catenovulum sp. 2E275]|uniref:GGDEF domain-containing protein n=1 Tax=Catenovulum sp. 2E275 TaxID=2980497 RepID=UPI0021CEAB26|nr:GGDEF domain-containing protein [Catenovulum sp. 2E275]MCU4676097.1 GGDEF domain-containing protein [Catenovulum sp. 2E275]
MFKNKLIQWCEQGTPPGAGLELKRKIFILNLFSFVGFSITATLGFSSFIQQNFILAFCLLAAALSFFLGHYILKTTHNYKVPSRGLLFALSALMLYLVYSGGVENTGPLWIYILPPVALFLGGLLSGLIGIFIFILCCTFLMFFQDGILLATNYSLTFKLRLVYSFLTVTFLSYCYEYSRKLSYQSIHELSDKFEKLAKYDPLTSLSNRRDMLEKIQTEVSRLSRSHNPACLLLCDIDHFKLINDTHGHEAGDNVLRELSKQFKSMIRQQDIVARWGGEEFLFLLPDTSLSNAQIAAENIRYKIENSTFNTGEKNISITLSIGVSNLSEHSSIKDSIAIADQYLYLAKQNGRNRVCSVATHPKLP